MGEVYVSFKPSAVPPVFEARLTTDGCQHVHMCMRTPYVLYVKYVFNPIGKQPKDGKKPEPCKPILKVEYKTTRAG